MAEFANQLCHLGHHVLHLTLDDTAEFSDLNMRLLSYAINMKLKPLSISTQRNTGFQSS